MKKGNAVVTLLIVLLFIVVIAMSVFIVWDKLDDTADNNMVQNNENDMVDNNTNNEVSKNEKEELTAKELEDIEQFINKVENNPFAVITYSNPADLFNDKNTSETKHYLQYAFGLSDYSNLAVMEGGFVGPQHYEISLENASKFLQSRMNYTYSDKTIADALNSYIIDNNMYRFAISDSIYCELETISGYKYDGKIYVTVTGNRTLTLTEQEGNYYFYSCEGLDL